MQKKSALKKFIQGRAFLLIVLAVVVLIITYAVQAKAFTRGNMSQIMATLSYLGVFTIGIACLLVGGGFDFSTSAHATVGILIFAQLLQWFPGLPWPVAMIGTLGFGIIAGLINAFFSEGLRLMAFICTIGMQSVWNGLSMWYTRGNMMPIYRAGFTKLATLYVAGSPVPWTFVFMVLIVILYSFILKWTRFGRSVLMSGGNPNAARLAGLKPPRIRTILFVNNGVLAGVAGLIWASQQKMASAQGLIQGTPEMTALTASILGGVSFIGGAGNLAGAFFGCVLIQILQYALQSMGLQLWFVTLVNGMLLVIALGIDSINTRRRTKGMGGGIGGNMGVPGMN